MVQRYETWKDGMTRILERDVKGHFVKGSHIINLGEYPTSRATKRDYSFGARIEEPEEPEKRLYRISFTLKNVPVHSDRKKQKENYYGFLIQAFDIDADNLRRKTQGLKNKMVELMVEYLQSQNYADDLRVWIHNEGITEIPYDRFSVGIWIFKVEHNGRVESQNERSGDLYSI